MNVVEIVKVQELQCKVALESVKSSPECLRVIPDHWLKEKARLDRAYLWNVLNHYHPDWVNEITRHAYKSRFVGVVGADNENAVKVCREVAIMLESMPYLPRK